MKKKNGKNPISLMTYLLMDNRHSFLSASRGWDWMLNSYFGGNTRKWREKRVEITPGGR